MTSDSFNSKKIIWFLFFVLVLFSSEAQHYRFSAEVSIKEKNDTSQKLILGKVYYDRNTTKTVFDLRFPEKEIWVIEDTNLYRIVKGKLVSVSKVGFMREFSFFDLALNGTLKNYGLTKTSFTIKKVEKSDDAVVTTWQAPEKAKKLIGDIVLSQKNKKLDAILFYNTGDTLLSKQFFKSYIKVKGIDIPTEQIQIFYPPKSEIYKIFTYKKIVIDEVGNDDMFNYRIPKR